MTLASLLSVCNMLCQAQGLVIYMQWVTVLT
ncbi:MAG: hypothetical protein K0R53_2634 [Burkholderiales bacterium]|nr:hypothetical protein [Burkholderiales bacterium]